MLVPISYTIIGITIQSLLPIATLPFLKYIIKLQEKIQGSPSTMYGLRYDMILQRLIGGIIIGFVLLSFLKLLPIPISCFWIAFIYCFSFFRLLLAWDKNKPWEYEASQTFSAIVGESLGFIIFILPYF